ncbi:MAG: GrpB family protein [Gemmatimonadaceae bacterium]
MILLTEYHSSWATDFCQEAERVWPAFGLVLIELHHIGSTAIPGILAKPVIDILAIVSDVNLLDVKATYFEALGYEVMGEFGLPGRRYFRRDDVAGVRTHHIHAYAPISSSEVERYLDFRDYLREHPLVAREYSDLKRSLARQCQDDTRYSDGKTDFIRDVERRAAIWQRESRSTRRPHEKP